MAYADYDFYCNTYHGDMDEADFLRTAEIASAYLDNITYGRITDDILSDDTLAKKIKLAVCACADVAGYYSDSSGGVIAAESVGEYSVSYRTFTAESSGSVLQSAMYASAHMFLSSTGLMYKGACDD